MPNDPKTPDDQLEIPQFLRRAVPADEPPAGQPVESVMVSAATETEAPAPKAKVAKAPKANGAANGAAKATTKAKPAPKAAKPAKTPAKAKAAPAKAKAESTVKRDAYGYRVGSLKAQAAAMYGSKHGATLGEVKAKLNSTQLNLLTELEAKGFKVKKTKEGGEGSRQVTRYYLTTK